MPATDSVTPRPPFIARTHAHIAKIARYIALPVLAALLAVGAAFIAPAQASALTYTWSLRNQTSQSIYLEIYTQRGSPSSSMIYSKDHPMKPGDYNSTQQSDDSPFSNTYYWGRFCYSGAWWNLKREAYNSVHGFVLEPSRSNPAELAMDSYPSMGGPQIKLIKTDAC